MATKTVEQIAVEKPRVTAAEIDGAHIYKDGNAAVIVIDGNEYWFDRLQYEQFRALGEWAVEVDLWA